MKMSSMVPKSQSTVITNKDGATEEEYYYCHCEGERDDQRTVIPVTRHLSIKPTHSSEILNKEVVLRRIRQRRRVNTVRAALKSFLRAPTPSSTNITTDNEVSVVHDIKWVDDAFAAL
ncbi:Histone-lysine N-methyltransferase [Quillaja saponaria]|uniref:Histone-lysine N-methyltransferase n=1 Tax=Quillaja saponaria TaxID=32244 RepID=A0AAD7M0V4_QUISA|nr:Histone-lysine N-methyltransferase [Quillaja saponaria]